MDLAGEVLLPATDRDQAIQLCYWKDTMLLILFCLARTFLPDVATWVSEIQTQAAILSFGTFAFLLYRLGLESSRRPSAGSHLENSDRLRQG
jgi:hypothetical protein